jgi:uncharacterized peroxidase-related enzyme
MTFLHTIPEDQADGEVAAMYETDRQAAGALPNYTRAFSLRPAVYARWRDLNVEVKRGMDARRYELASVAAARRLRCSYCALAHGTVMLDRGMLEADALETAVGDRLGDGLDATDAAVMELADQIAADATAVTPEHMDRLRSLGLTDTEIFDVVMAAALRCFFAKALDALGAEPDPRFHGLEDGLRDALTVGRPIAEAQEA